MPTDRIQGHRFDMADMSADLIAGRRFAQTWRGYDPEEVKEFLAQVADQVRALRERLEVEIAARREAEQRALHPHIDEATLMSAVGDQTAAILRSARGAAAEITAKAAANAESLLGVAEGKASDLVADAEALLASRTAEAESAANEIWTRALAEVEELRNAAQQDAEAMAQEGAQRYQEVIEAAEAVREKILTDLARRRNLATVQIEQLRAGRERLLDAYLVVRRTLDEVTDELQRADAEARGAAIAVGRTERDEVTGELVDLRREEVWDPVSVFGGADTLSATGVTKTGEVAPVVLAPKVTQVASTVPAVVPGAPGAPLRGKQPGTNDEDEKVITGPVSMPAPLSSEGPPEARTADEQGAGEDDGVATGEGAVDDATLADAVPTAALVIENQGQDDLVPDDLVPDLVVEALAIDGEDPVTTSTAEPTIVVEPAIFPEPATSPERDGIESVRIIRPGPETAPAQDASVRPGGKAQTAQTAPTAPSTTGPGPEGAQERDVEGLFARIRADREQATIMARKALAEDEAAPSGGDREEAAPAPGTGKGQASGGKKQKQQVESTGADRPADEASEANPVVATNEAEALAAAPDSGTDAVGRFFELRNEMAGDLGSSLARKLKRALQDQQNSLLDQLRKSGATPANVLPEEDPDRFVEAGRPLLARAVRSGAELAAVLCGDDALRRVASANGVDDLAEDLGRAIAGPLHQRLELAISSAGDDPSEVADALGAAYREWKTQRIEAAAQDEVAAAFSRGVYLTFPDETLVRWVVDPSEGPCPDCEDNALAGDQPKGQAWPTGQLHPPAHPGCRCALAPASMGDVSSLSAILSGGHSGGTSGN
ncbi:MAG TPA: DivIVA domain-containing protein [Acidimicrobiales bacterium]|nr:DivIVA domain-containing protein [Acidimicrobiales bacterium]